MCQAETILYEGKINCENEINVLTLKILPPVSLTPVANLPPVSLTPVVNLQLRISPRIFEKIRNGPYGILKGLGETDS